MFALSVLETVWKKSKTIAKYSQQNMVKTSQEHNVFCKNRLCNLYDISREPDDLLTFEKSSIVMIVTVT